MANILEGSVRLYNNTVRISVQLIRAATDEHLWAEVYDRNFSDIFSIQSEVAQEVVNAAIPPPLIGRKDKGTVCDCVGSGGDV